MRRLSLTFLPWLLGAALLLSAPHAAPAAQEARAAKAATKASTQAQARRTSSLSWADYWRVVDAKRRARMAKLRNGEAIGLDDYVLAQPPAYRREAAPPGPRPVRHRIPVLKDFLKAAADEFGFVPQRAAEELEFKRGYARAALAAGLTRDQVVRIYAFETGGLGAHDTQAGLLHRRPGARPISAALGYNQLLSTNSIGLMAAHGDRFVAALHERAEVLAGAEQEAIQRRIAAVKRMVAFSRSVPYAWSVHDKLAKTPGGIGIHAAVLDRDLGPLMQVQKLLESVTFARRNGVEGALAAVELQMMNFTGDGNGLDMILMPEALRAKVPTANFFQPRGYARNPIARRTATVAGLFAAIDAKMDRAASRPGAQELAAQFAIVRAQSRRAE